MGYMAIAKNSHYMGENPNGTLSRGSITFYKNCTEAITSQEYITCMSHRTNNRINYMLPNKQFGKKISHL